MVTREFFESVRRHLGPGGTVIVNVGPHPRVERARAGRLGDPALGLPGGGTRRVGDANSLVVGSVRPLSAAHMVAAGPGLPSDLQGLDASAAGRLGPAVRGGAVYTDDRAPVEWLTDLSILRYATGSR